jgi:predicted transcriptional regulator
MSRGIGMTTKQLKQSAKQQLEALSGDRLQSAEHFLRYLNDLESQAATDEILAIPGALDAVKKGLADIEAGRTVSVSKLKRKYKRV